MKQPNSKQVDDQGYLSRSQRLSTFIFIIYIFSIFISISAFVFCYFPFTKEGRCDCTAGSVNDLEFLNDPVEMYWIPTAPLTAAASLACHFPRAFLSTSSKLTVHMSRETLESA